MDKEAFNAATDARVEALIVAGAPPVVQFRSDPSIPLWGPPGEGKTYHMDMSSFGQLETYRELVTTRREILTREYRIREQMIFDDPDPIDYRDLSGPYVGERKVDRKAKSKARAANKVARKARRKG